MASVVLSRFEAEEGDLPDVCMRSEGPATGRKRWRFTSHPFWVYALLPLGYIPYAVVAALLTERVLCWTFFCPRHANHWSVRAWLVWGSLPVIFALFIGGMALLFHLDDPSGRSAAGPLAGLLCIVTAALLILWLASIPLSQLTAIHPAHVTRRHLTLRNVSPAFVEAVRDHQERRAAAVDREEYREKFRPRPGRSGRDVYDPER